MTVAFMLIWNAWPNSGRVWKIPVIWFQAAGIILLVILAIIYKGGSPEDPVWMKPYWWGILGLIGWSYLLCSLLYLVVRQNFWMITGTVFLLYFLNFQEFSPLFERVPDIKLIISASNYSLVMSGVLASALLFQLPFKPGREWKYSQPAHPHGLSGWHGHR